MHPLIRQLHDLSYSRRGIATSCALLLLMGLTIAGVTGTVMRLIDTPEPTIPLDPIERIYQQYLQMNFGQTVQESLGLPEAADPNVLPSTLFQEPTSLWLPAVQQAASDPQPAPGTRFALGLWEHHQGDPQRAINLFHQENIDFPHPLVRRCEVDATLRAKDAAHLNTLRSNPDYVDQLSANVFYRMGMLTNNWQMILRWFWQAQYQRMPLSMLALSLIAGAIWTALMLSLFPVPRPKAVFLWVPLALALGWISTWPTVWSNIWLDGTFHLEEGNDFISALMYFLVSVGLREELCKLLLFTPFLFRVVKNGRDLEALIFGALVGLGFAVEENISYFTQYQGSGVVISRYVSSNLLHLTLTGVNALALTRAIRDPGRWTADAVQTLAMTIGLHAIYNTLLSQPVPGLGDMSYFSGAALAGCTYLFFREVHGLSSAQGLKISRTALYCWGFCFLFNLELLSASVWLPFDKALYLTGSAALSVVFIGYIFIHEISEPLAP